MIMLDNCEPYSVEYDDNAVSIVLQVPQQLLRERFRSPERCTGRKLSRLSGINRIAGDFLASCAAHAGDLTADQRALTSGMSLGLLSDVLIDETSRDGGCRGQQAILMARVKQFVLSQAADPSLDVRRVASTMGLSSRYVTKLFTADGEPLGRFLLRARVERSKRDLSNTALWHLNVGEIGIRAGFSNLSHFSRVFRDATWQTPTEYRRGTTR